MDEDSYTLEGDNSFDGLDFEQTIDKMIELRCFNKPVLYFATSEFLPRCDRLCIVPEGDFHPGYFICHPDDTDKLRLEFTLVPLSEYHFDQLTKVELSVISEKIGETIRGILNTAIDEEFLVATKSKRLINSLHRVLGQSY